MEWRILYGTAKLCFAPAQARDRRASATAPDAYIISLIEPARHVEAIIAVVHDLDAAAFAAIAEQHDRVATPRPHSAIVPISRGQRKALYVPGGGKPAGCVTLALRQALLLAPQDRGHQGRYLIFFRGLWQPTE